MLYPGGNDPIALIDGEIPVQLKSLHFYRNVGGYPLADGLFRPHFVELLKRDCDVAGEGKIPDLGSAAEFHGHIHQSPWVWARLSQPDVEDVAAIHNREEDMLDLHAFG